MTPAELNNRLRALERGTARVVVALVAAVVVAMVVGSVER